VESPVSWARHQRLLREAANLPWQERTRWLLISKQIEAKALAGALQVTGPQPHLAAGRPKSAAVWPQRRGQDPPAIAITMAMIEPGSTLPLLPPRSGAAALQKAQGQLRAARPSSRSLDSLRLAGDRRLSYVRRNELETSVLFELKSATANEKTPLRCVTCHQPFASGTRFFPVDP